MKDAVLEEIAPPPREDYKVAPKFNATKIKRQIRRVEAERKIERQLAAKQTLCSLGVLNADGSWKF